MAQAARAPQWSEERGGKSLFKADHPRAIDRYIDYFGGSTDAAQADAWGESLLEHLA